MLFAVRPVLSRPIDLVDQYPFWVVTGTSAIALDRPLQSFGLVVGLIRELLDPGKPIVEKNEKTDGNCSVPSQLQQIKHKE